MFCEETDREKEIRVGQVDTLLGATEEIKRDKIWDSGDLIGGACLDF